ncbi:hypothetical protein B0H11DRAFT_2188131 [Mycena galericulata]|nr:hypothetical protein B0H11DRAFT_2188131 [Mycena galericulata]
MPPGIKRSSRSQQIASKTGPGVHHTSPLEPRDKRKNRIVVPIGHDAKIKHLRARLDALRNASLAGKKTDGIEMSESGPAPDSAPPPIFTPSTSAAEANNRRRASWDVLLPHLKDPAEHRLPSHGQTKRKKPIVLDSEEEEDDHDDIPLAKRPKATLDYIAVPPQFVQGSSKGTRGAQGSAAKHRIDRRGVPAPPSAPPPAPASSAAPPPVDTAAIAAAIAAALTAMPPEALAAMAILLLAAVPREALANLATLLSATAPK